MAVPVHVPRVNNNDDVVKVVALAVAVGDRVAQGQVIGQVETDKAVVDVESPQEGYVIALRGVPDSMAQVGSILVWLGERSDEVAPAAPAAADKQAARAAGGAPTAKAQALLREHGLDAAVVPASGERLTAADVERHLARGQEASQAAAAPRASAERAPEIAGTARELKSDERGMLATVRWHHEHAVAGYIETAYDTGPWEEFAKAYAARNRLLFSPLLSLMAWRLAELAIATPRLNATIYNDRRHEYAVVNVGFTVQVGETLYLAVVRDAAALGQERFVTALGELQRKAAAHKLGPAETQGTTIGFSSMARWNVRRHMPVLAPQTAVMVAHAGAGPDGQAVMGASYDHRVLNGFHVVDLLRKLATPGGAA